MTYLTGKVALVTGATRGLGKGIAIGLGEAGATVYITGRSWAQSTGGDNISGTLQETQQAVEEAGGICHPVQLDHNDDEQVRLLFERIQAEQGKLDVLVNNVFAGVQTLRNSYGKPFWHHEPQIWDTINNVGLRSHYVASVYAARLMSKHSQGLICTISSWGGMSYIFGVAYGAGKSACDRLAADMAVELKADNITSVAIWPGIVGTEHISRFAEEMSSEASQATFGNGYNWETPLLTGRAIAALAAEPDLIKHTGKVKIVAELAEKYNLVDENRDYPSGTLRDRPISLRSLRFLLPFLLPQLQQYAGLIPNIKVPWWLLLITTLQSPRI
jgi:NAD(P)-dependent dehydrogenase (short-subunit alcohol dehydrogenase family)